MDAIVTSVLTAFENAVEPQELHESLRNGLALFGFDRFTYLALRTLKPLKKRYSFSTYPQKWARHYSSHGYIDIDPVVAAATQRIKPVKWISADLAARLSRRQVNIFGEASDFGIENGITIPIHAQGGQFATLSVASDQPRREFERLSRESRYSLHLIALYYHDAVVSKVLQNEYTAAPHLSPREMECLLWCARGKTAWETGEVLSISEDTVVFHIKNAMRKFGVFSKHHAVVKAIMCGLIHP